MATAFRWRDDHVEPFLDLYKQQECLWDISNEFYRNKLARDIAYRKICDSLNLRGLKISDVKNKIKIIRTNYKCELNKIKRSNKTKPYVPRVFWFKKADEFLRIACDRKDQVATLKFHVSNRHLRDVLSSKVENSTVNVDLNTGIASYPHMKSTSTDTYSQMDISSIDTYAQMQTIPADTHSQIKITPPDTHSQIKNTLPNIHPRTKNTFKHRKRIKEKRSSLLSTIDNSIQKLQEISDCLQTSEDEFDLFGRSIAIQLKKMPLERALICQESIQSVIRKERVNQLSYSLSNPTNRSSTSAAPTT